MKGQKRSIRPAKMRAKKLTPSTVYCINRLIPKSLSSRSPSMAQKKMPTDEGGHVKNPLLP
jgi:hypothetical protein